MYVSVFMGPSAPSPAQDGPLIDQCLHMAADAAAAGFAMVTFGEQHFNSYEPYCNPFLMAARLAPVLGECWFGTTIVPLPFHPVLSLAEDTSVVDYLTRGRLLVGMSSGRVGPGSDFAVHGLDPGRRAEMFASKLELLQRTYAHRAGDQPLVLDTEWDRATVPGRLMPVPFRAGGPQLAVGTNTDSTIDDVARRGLALFLGPCTATDAATKLRRHRAGLVGAGHPADVVADVTTKSLVTRFVVVAPTEDEAWDTADEMTFRSPMMDRRADRRPLRELAAVPLDAIADDPCPRNVGFAHSWITVGTPDSVAGQMHGYADLGVPHVNVRFTVGPHRPVEVNRSFRLFAAEVLPALGAQRFAGPTLAQTSPEHRPGAADRMPVPVVPAAAPLAHSTVPAIAGTA